MGGGRVQREIVPNSLYSLFFYFELFPKLGVLDEVTTSNLQKLDGIPVDIRPCYPLAGEVCGDLTETGQ